MNERKPLLKIQYGDVYVSLPTDDLEAIQFVDDVLQFFLDYFKSHEGEAQK